MESLYLMRRGRYEVHGPLPASQWKAILSKHAPLSQWEVAGHLGPWISVENDEKLKETYGDLWKALRADSFSWKALFKRKK